MMKNKRKSINIKGIKSRFQKEAALYLFPLLVIMILVVVAPIISTFINSFYKDNMFNQGNAEFIGLRNYLRLLTKSDFFSILGFTLKLTFAAVGLEIVFGLGITMLLKEKFRGSILIRTLVLIPWVIPGAVIARIWMNIFEYSNGILNYILSDTLGLERINWFASADSSFFIIVIAEIWRTTGFVVIILLTGYYSIPKDIFKQAKIDGSSMTNTFFKITLPLLRPYVVIAAIFRIVDTLRIFDLIYDITGGGPGGTTDVLASKGFIYFKDMNYGMGSAFTTVAFIISLIIAILIIKFGKLNKVD